VDQPVRAGSHAIRFEVPHKPGSFRSEIALSPVPLFSDYWYSFSIFVPEDWIDDPEEGDIVAQWHGSYGEGKKQFKVEGDGKGRPPVALSLHADRWELAINSSDAVVKDAKDWETTRPNAKNPISANSAKASGPTGSSTCTGPISPTDWSKSGRTEDRS